MVMKTANERCDEPVVARIRSKGGQRDSADDRVRRRQQGRELGDFAASVREELRHEHESTLPMGLGHLRGQPVQQPREL